MKKIIKRIISAVLSVGLMFLAVPGDKIFAAGEGEEKLGITVVDLAARYIFANGNSIIILDKDGNADTQTDTLIYLDSDNNGELDDSEKVPVDLTAKGLPASYGKTSTGFDLSGVGIVGGCLGSGGILTESSKYVSKTKITMIGGTVLSINGGSRRTAEVKNGTSVTISGLSHIRDNVYGSGYDMTDVGGNTNVVIKDSARIGDSVYGGGSTSCNVDGDTNVSISDSASIGGSVFGGGSYESGISGSTNVNISGSAIITDSVFGGGIDGCTIQANTNVNISGSASIGGSVCGGGKKAIILKFGIPINGVYGSTNITVKDKAHISGDVIGGGIEDAAEPPYGRAVCGNTNVDISESAHITGSLWGGGNGYASTGGIAFVNISDGVSIGTVNGGGNSKKASVSGYYVNNIPAKTISVSGDITLPQNLTVSSDQTMTILNDSILRIPSGMTLENNGTIINNKTIINNGTISGTGILKNIITYVLNGGVNNPANTDYYAYGTGLTLQDPTYSPQKFGGWYTNSDYIEGSKVVSFGSNETVAKTIYAKWINPAAHTVAYDANSATGGTVPTDTHTYLAGAIVPVAGNPGGLVRTGYTFGGWSTSLNGTAETTYTMGTSNVTFYAVWKPTYTVTYDANGASKGTVPTDSSTYAAGATVPVAGNPGGLVRTGYIFGGWSTSLNGTAETTYTMGSSNVIFYAVWTSDNNSAGSPISVTSPENIGLPHPDFISARPIGNAFDEPASLSILPAPNNRERFRQAFKNGATNRPLLSDNDAFYFEMDMLSQITGKKLQPKDGTGVEITIPLPENFYKDKGSVIAVTIYEGKAEVLPTEAVYNAGVWGVKLTVTHFSPYALIIDRDGSFSSLAAGAPVNEISTPIEQPSGVPYMILSLGLTAGMIFFNTKRLKNRK